MYTTYGMFPLCCNSSVGGFLSVPSFRGLSLLAAVLMALGSWEYVAVDSYSHKGRQEAVKTTGRSQG